MDQKTPQETKDRDGEVSGTIAPLPGQEMPPPKRLRFELSPINIRRWRNFRANRRGYWSLWIFLVLFVVTLFAEFIANDRPLIVSYKGEILFPVIIDYPEEKFGGFLAVTDYRSPFVQGKRAAAATPRASTTRTARSGTGTGSGPTIRRATCWRG
jgi:microcin C transport system permease protein